MRKMKTNSTGNAAKVIPFPTKKKDAIPTNDVELDIRIEELKKESRYLSSMVAN